MQTIAIFAGKEAWLVRSQPPPPPSTMPPFVPPSSPGMAGAPPPGKRRFPWLWLLFGCGCLIVLLVLVGAIVGVGYFAFKEAPPRLQSLEKEIPFPPGPKTDTKPAPSSQTSPHVETRPQVPASASPKTSAPAPKKTTLPSSAGPRPSRNAALRAALRFCEKGWVAKIVRHNADWTKVTVAVGPPASEWVGEIDLQWRGNGYVAVKKRAISY